MLRLLLKLSLLMSVLFALAIGIIRAQPYDDGELRAFLFNSPGCEMIPDDAPCFMGIELGITTFDAAAEILRQRDWIGWVSETTPASTTIWWSWSGEQPSFVSNNSYGMLSVTNSSTVAHIEIETDLQAGELYLTLGPPDAAFDGPPPSNMTNAVTMSQYYIDNRIQALALGYCPVSYFSLSKSRIRIHWDESIRQLNPDVLTAWDEVLPSEWCNRHAAFPAQS
jgi:hypothetical protein